MEEQSNQWEENGVSKRHRVRPEPVPERRLTAVETSPFEVRAIPRFVMASEEERQEIKRQNPELNVRLATREEEQSLAADIRDEDV